MMKNTKNKQTLSSTFGKRSVRAGGYSTILSLVVIAVAIAVNLFVSALPSHLTKIDNSSIDLYTLTDETKTQIAALTEDVTIYLVAPTGSEDNILTEFLNRYKALSPHIKIEYVDPIVRPNFTQSYTDIKLEANSIIIESARRSRVIPINKIFVAEIDYSTYTETQSFHGEDCITSGIDYVTTEKIPVVYTLSGHAETAPSETLLNYIDQASIEVKSLSLIKTGSVPEDADCILIYNPKYDITEDEVELLKNYISEGGNLLLLTEAIGASLENLNALMETYGTTGNNGVVIEKDASHHVPNIDYFLFPTLKSHPITTPIIDAKRTILMPYAQGITVSETLPEGVSVTTLLSTSNKAYLYTEPEKTTDEEETYETGTYALGVAITAGKGKAVWFSSNFSYPYSPFYFTYDYIDANTAGANSSLLLNSLNWM